MSDFFMLRETVKRIRGSQLQRIRAYHLSKNPLCVMCKKSGIITQATQVDHITPLHKFGTETEDNRQGLCEECHLKKSTTERGYTYRPRVKIGVDGWPIQIKN